MLKDDTELNNNRNYQRKVLLVDDSPVNLMLTKKLLVNLGLTVVTAINGLEAVDYAAQERFHLIFMDLEMPVLGGVDASIKIREQQLSKALLKGVGLQRKQRRL